MKQLSLNITNNNDDFVITHDQNVIDIINAVLIAETNSRNVTKKLSFELMDITPEKTCFSIWNFLKLNLKYKAEKENLQTAKEVQRVLTTDSNDCKHYSTLAISILCNCGYNCFFRFVSFDKSKEPTHVYAVCLDSTGNELIIDGTINKFNFESNYNYRYDIQPLNYKPMLKYLNGTAVRGLDDIGISGTDYLLTVPLLVVRQAMLLLIKLNWPVHFKTMLKKACFNSDGEKKIKKWWQAFGGSWNVLKDNIGTYLDPSTPDMPDPGYYWPDFNGVKVTDYNTAPQGFRDNLVNIYKTIVLPGTWNDFESWIFEKWTTAGKQGIVFHNVGDLKHKFTDDGKLNTDWKYKLDMYNMFMSYNFLFGTQNDLGFIDLSWLTPMSANVTPVNISKVGILPAAAAAAPYIAAASAIATLLPILINMGLFGQKEKDAYDGQTATTPGLDGTPPPCPPYKLQPDGTYLYDGPTPTNDNTGLIPGTKDNTLLYVAGGGLLIFGLLSMSKK